MAVRQSASGQHFTRAVNLTSQTAFAVACWLKISEDRDAVSTVWSLDDNDGFETAVGLKTSANGTTIGVEDFSAGVVASRALTVGVWYYVGVAVNGSNGVMVSKGATDSSFTVATWATSVNTDHTTLRIGDDGFAQWFNGAVSGFKWWQGALSQAELESEAGSLAPRRTANLRAWYPWTRVETVDYSGNGQTLSGGTGATTEDGPPVPWRRGRHRLFTPGEIPAEVTPALIQATVSVPTPAVSTGTTVAAPHIAATSTVPTPDVFVGGAVTPVNPPRIDATAAVPAPAVTTVKNVSVTAPRIAATALVRTPTVSVPITPGSDLDGKGQISYNGFRIGGGTVYSLQRMVGSPWDLPGLDQGDEPHPSADGALAGQDLAQARIFLAELLIKAPRDEIEAAADAFVIGLPKAQADERLPIAVQVLDNIWIGYGRVTARTALVEKRTPLGHVPAAVQFTMSDPRFYSRALQSAEVPDGGDVDVMNSGNTETFPLFRAPGPATNPLVEITRILPDETEDIRVIEYNVTVDVGEFLILDVKRGTVMIGDESQARYRVNGSVSIPDMVLGPGVSTIAYETAEGDAPNAVVLWNHAIM